MKDCENLSRLLRRLPVDQCQQWFARKSLLQIPQYEPDQKITAWRKQVTEYIATLPLQERQELEEHAERICLICDGPGQDATAQNGQYIFDDIDREHFYALPNQYQRALWLYMHEPYLFDRTLHTRQADLYRQLQSCYSGYVVPAGLTLLEDDHSLQQFHQALANHLGSPVSDVAIQLFHRVRPGSGKGREVVLYQLSFYHNRPPESIDVVKQSQVAGENVIRAVHSHLTYEPESGHLEVLTKNTKGREQLAALMAEYLLQSPFLGESIPIKQYRYQSLASPRFFDIRDEPIASVKVTEAGFTTHGLTARFTLVHKGQNSIYAQLCQQLGKAFKLSTYSLNYARLTITLRKMNQERARTLHIVFRGQNGCNIKTQREKDRALCDRMLVHWGLIREVAHAKQRSVL